MRTTRLSVFVLTLLGAAAWLATRAIGHPGHSGSHAHGNRPAPGARPGGETAAESVRTRAAPAKQSQKQTVKQAQKQVATQTGRRVVKQGEKVRANPAGKQAAKSAAPDAAAPAAGEPPLRWWKGNLHTHSLWSDGDDFPEMISDWYRGRGYHFLAISDHNVLAKGLRWMKHAEIIKRGGKDALAKYRSRFGAAWVETRGNEDALEIRLKPFSEYRALVEERDRFLLLQAEEISDKAEGLPVHLNASNIQELILPLGGVTVRDTIAANVRAVEEQATKTGAEILVHLNHPNFGWAITAEEMATVVGERFFEVYNGHPGIRHLGDEHHPAVERLWDIANTIRIATLKSPPLFALATDDTHDYHGEPGARPGRGWIMVPSRYLTPEHLLRAIKAGEHYASSGVTLKEVRYDRETKKIKIEIDAQPGVEYRTEFIGTPVEYDKRSEPAPEKDGKPVRATRRYSTDVGKVFATAAGASAEYPLTGKELYVRACITSTQDHVDPSFKGQKQQAWTQPFGWEGRVQEPAAKLPAKEDAK